MQKKQCRATVPRHLTDSGESPRVWATTEERRNGGSGNRAERVAIPLPTVEPDRDNARAGMMSPPDEGAPLAIRGVLFICARAHAVRRPEQWQLDSMKTARLPKIVAINFPH